MAPRRARAAARGAVGFAVLGVLAGLGFVLASSAGVLPVAVTGGRPHIAADLAYHLSVLVVLLAVAPAPPPAEPVVSVRGLGKRYGSHEAGAGLDLQVRRGGDFRPPR